MPNGDAESQKLPEGKTPGTVPMSDYIGVKEMLRKREEALVEARKTSDTLQTQIEQGQAKVGELKAEVLSLTDQLTQAKQSSVDPEELKKVQEELVGVKEKLKQSEVTILQTKKAAITQQFGVNPDDVKEMSEIELDSFLRGLQAVKGQGSGKPGADLGTGGGAGLPTSARDKMKTGFDELHPSH